MNIIIIGQGAIGLLWYHHIQQLINNHADYKKTQLHLLPSHKTLKEEGQYTFTDNSNVIYTDEIHYANAQNIAHADLVILCVKSFQISLALKKIENNLASTCHIILAHNGMGTLTELSETLLKRHNIYALLTTHGCLRTAPLTIRHTGVGVTDIGLLAGRNHLSRKNSITQLLNNALPQVTFHKNIKQKQWLKLAINCAINPLTAIHNINNGQINNSEFLTLINTLLEEVVAVADAEKVTLDLAMLKQTVKQVANATAKNSSSMRCDVLAHRRSEIDYISGYIHRLGLKHNIATPENTKMWQTVKMLVPKG